MLHYTASQRPHWTCRQHGNSEGAQRWLGVERCHTLPRSDSEWPFDQA